MSGNPAPSVESLTYDVSHLPRMEDWDEFFLAFCFLMARKSKDPSSKTGCVVTRDRRILSTGYNGFAPGVEDSPELYADRPTKYARIVHADSNAIMGAAREGISLKDGTMYLTGPPCANCAKHIIASGITGVVWPAHNKFEDDPATFSRWKEDFEHMTTMFDQAGVAYRRWNR